MQSPHRITEDERRRLMAGEMPEGERRKMLERISSHWTSERIADAIVERAEASGLSVLGWLKMKSAGAQ